MNLRYSERLDRILSSLAAVATFIFFMSVISVGWFQVLQVMARG